MKQFSLLLLGLLLFSCSSKSDNKIVLTSDFGPPAKLTEHIQKDFKTWWTYHKKYSLLSRDFTPLDESGRVIKKTAYLKQLATGKYISIRLYDPDSTIFYKLYTMNPQAALYIQDNVKDDAAAEYARMSWEGDPFPDFEFTDLNGVTYRKEDLKGKTVFFKTWFIGCKPCIAEMPDLNAMVAHYKDREDVLFISVALDKAGPLEKFLSKTQFDYAVVADQKKFLRSNEFFQTFNAFPTHVVMDKQGKVAKVTSSYEELEYAVERMEL